jgi:hypothetical protein
MLHSSVYHDDYETMRIERHKIFGDKQLSNGGNQESYSSGQDNPKGCVSSLDAQCEDYFTIQSEINHLKTRYGDSLEW